jgi:hypothetical protein
MPFSAAIGFDILFDLLYQYMFPLFPIDDTVEFNRALVIVVGTVHFASSVCTAFLHEIYALFLRIWVEIIVADEEIYTWVWNHHLEVYVGEL